MDLLDPTARINGIENSSSIKELNPVGYNHSNIIYCYDLSTNDCRHLIELFKQFQVLLKCYKAYVCMSVMIYVLL